MKLKNLGSIKNVLTRQREASAGIRRMRSEEDRGKE